MVWQPGESLKSGEYTIEKELGKGGFAITYLAKKSNDERVVIKTLKDELRQRPDFDQFHSNFLQEAEKISKFQHRHIVKVYELFPQDGLWCMVMEYISGESLGSRIRKLGALTETEALRYIQQIGEALQVVHAAGVLHRDIKPDNIIIRSHSLEAVLIDFGIAREFEPNQPNNNINFLSKGYAPIEQYIRSQREGAYTDIYALAATLYVLLTGNLDILPSALDRDNETKKLGKDPLFPPKHHNQNISKVVNQAIIKGMSLEAKKRPQSVETWLKMLIPQTAKADDNSQTGLDTDVVSPGNKNLHNQSDKNPKAKKTNKSLIYIFLLLITALVGGFSVWWFYLRRVPPTLNFTINPVYNSEKKQGVILEDAEVCDEISADRIQKVHFWLRTVENREETIPKSIEADDSGWKDSRIDATPFPKDDKCSGFSHEIKAEDLKPGDYELKAVAYNIFNQSSEPLKKKFKVNAKPKNLSFGTTYSVYDVGDNVNLNSVYVCDDNGLKDINTINFSLRKNGNSLPGSDFSIERNNKPLIERNNKQGNNKPLIERNNKQYFDLPSQTTNKFSSEQENIVCGRLTFSHSINNLSAGSYELIAFTKDISGEKSNEYTRSFKINASPKNLTFSWDKYTYNVGEKLTVTQTNICDDNGWDDIKEVIFYYKLASSSSWIQFGSRSSSLERNSNLCAVSNSSFTLDLNSSGDYELKATGSDKNGKTVDSGEGKFTVIQPFASP